MDMFSFKKAGVANAAAQAPQQLQVAEEKTQQKQDALASRTPASQRLAAQQAPAAQQWEGSSALSDFYKRQEQMAAAEKAKNLNAAQTNSAQYSALAGFNPEAASRAQMNAQAGANVANLQIDNSLADLGLKLGVGEKADWEKSWEEQQRMKEWAGSDPERLGLYNSTYGATQQAQNDAISRMSVASDKSALEYGGDLSNFSLDDPMWRKSVDELKSSGVVKTEMNLKPDEMQNIGRDDWNALAEGNVGDIVIVNGKPAKIAKQQHLSNAIYNVGGSNFQRAQVTVKFLDSNNEATFGVQNKIPR
jgi:hypothetical protein